MAQLSHFYTKKVYKRQEKWPPLGPFLPARKVLFLLGREAIDSATHGCKLHGRDHHLGLLWNVIHPGVERLFLGSHPSRAERLGCEAHIHHRSRMPFGRSEID